MKPKVPSGEKLPQTASTASCRHGLQTMTSEPFGHTGCTIHCLISYLPQSQRTLAISAVGSFSASRSRRPHRGFQTGFCRGSHKPAHAQAPSFVCTHPHTTAACTHTHTQLWHCLSVLQPGPPMGSFPAQAIPHPSFGADQPVRQYGAAHTRHHRCLVYRWQRKYEFWVIALF